VQNAQPYPFPGFPTDGFPFPNRSTVVWSRLSPPVRSPAAGRRWRGRAELAATRKKPRVAAGAGSQVGGAGLAREQAASAGLVASSLVKPRRRAAIRRGGRVGASSRVRVRGGAGSWPQGGRPAVRRGGESGRIGRGRPAASRAAFGHRTWRPRGLSAASAGAGSRVAAGRAHGRRRCRLGTDTRVSLPQSGTIAGPRALGDNRP